MTPTRASSARATLSEDEQPRGPALPGIFLGIGFDGFVDGIVLHQIL